MSIKFVSPDEVNSFIALYLVGNAKELLYVKDIEERNLGIRFIDYLKAQLRVKIVSTTYSELINTIVQIRNITDGLNTEDLNENVFKDMSESYCEFARIFSVISIYLHLAYGISMELCFPKEIVSKFCKDESITDEADDDNNYSLQLFKTTTINDDIDEYKEILESHNIFVMDLKELDFEFLSRQLFIYRSANLDIGVVWEGGLC